MDADEDYTSDHFITKLKKRADGISSEKSGNTSGENNRMKRTSNREKKCSEISKYARH